MIFATKMDMYNTFRKWNDEKFNKAFFKLSKSAKPEDKESLELLEHVIKAQSLWGKKMTGSCSQKRIYTDEENLRIWFSVIVNALEDGDDFWTPLDYVHGVCKHMLNDKNGYEKMAKDRFGCDFQKLAVMICGRALRNLPSFIREFQLRNAIEDRFPEGVFEKDVMLDLDGHCDLRMIYNGVEYRFWSFQSTKRGIKNFREKFNGTRGKLVNCVHVTCPIDTFKQINSCDCYGWRMYSTESIDYIYNLIVADKCDNYSVVDVATTDFSVPMVIRKSNNSKPTQAA